MSQEIKIAIAGEGGQGVQSVAEMLSEAAYGEGKETLYIPNFGVEQRGGVSVAYVQISDEPVTAPKFKIGDIVVALSERAVHRTRSYIGTDTLFIHGTHVGKVEGLATQHILAIPAVEVAKDKLTPRVFNVIILGALVEASGVVKIDDVKKAMNDKLGYKFEADPSLRELNYRALDMGREMVSRALPLH